MLEYIKDGDTILAIIVRATYKHESVSFFTPNNFSQQLGYMNRAKGYIVEPHNHLQQNRAVHNTQEVIIIRSGSARVDFYSQQNAYHSSRILYHNDIILLAAGGHGFEMLEDTELIEIKQGPYNDTIDKQRFEGRTDNFLLS